MRTEYLLINGGMAERRKDRFAFVMESLLRSRQSAGLETGGHRPDEDVNMYLASLLCDYTEHCAAAVHGNLIIPYDIDLAARVCEADQLRTKYQLYRCNADHLLVSLGLFGNSWLRKASQAKETWAPTREQSIGRGKSYYARASVYASRLSEGRRGLDDLLAKLDIGFEEYLTILETLRSEHFNLRQIFTVGEWYHFCREMGFSAEDGPRAS